MGVEFAALSVLELPALSALEAAELSGADCELSEDVTALFPAVEDTGAEPSCESDDEVVLLHRNRYCCA